MTDGQFAVLLVVCLLTYGLWAYLWLVLLGGWIKRVDPQDDDDADEYD